ncbi:MAG: arginine repressor [Nitriliruptorales bacterium]
MNRTELKAQRQRALVSLLHDRDVHSQEAALALLAERGIATTQATVSRDLDEIGAVKVRGTDGDLVYRISPGPVPATARERLAEVLRQFVIDVAASGNLTVLRTPPAGAGPVASAIDHAEVPGALATIAGDDTVVVVAAEGVGGRDLADRFRQLAEI